MAVSLAPTATTYRPNRVYFSVTAATTASTINNQTPTGKTIHCCSTPSLATSEFSHVIGASTFCSDASPFAAPRTMRYVPSVTMKGATLSRVISSPFTAPHNAPAPTPASRAAPGGQTSSILAITTVTNAMIDATERSIPPVMITKVIPIAERHTTVACRASVWTLSIVLNRGARALK